MNITMSSHLQRLAVRLMFSILFFVIVSTSLAAMSRYRQNLTITVAQHKTLLEKLGHMHQIIAEEREAITIFNNLLPADYGVKSSDLFIYKRLDEIKSLPSVKEMTVKAIETKDGERIAHFLFKIQNPDYSQVLNRLATLETKVFPFVSISLIEISKQSGITYTGLAMTIEGDVTMPAYDTAASLSLGTGKP
ncbi:MAG: hypothetical protein PHP95_10150 [Desulfuromonadaceae bacterium]|nr:hypothetical protein [Desulfuromonadaceae bacterium]MDD2848805.1 hypothetical protein [Desulfuromonadaceae bacterium]MDD4130455.1 hypothetical protein [Desulfuromonadaceae bacterium]